MKPIPHWFLFVVSLLACGQQARAIIDANTNGMSDVWEKIYSATNLNANGDTDGDGQSNYQESVAGTDPRDPQSVFRITASPVLSTAYLVRWPSVSGIRYQVLGSSNVAGPWAPQSAPLVGTGQELLAAVPTNAASNGPLYFSLGVLSDNPAIEWSRPYIGDLDTDGDGVADIDEYAAGTDPTDPTSRPGLTSVGVGRAMTLQWHSVALKYYQVKARASVADPWTSFGGPLVGTGSDLTATVEVSTNAQLFCVQVYDVDSDHDGANDWEQGMAGIAPGFYYGPGAHDTNPPPNAAVVATMLKATNVLIVTPSVAVADVTTLSPGSFRLVRTGNLDPITVQLTVSGPAVPGVDYQPLPASVKFGAGVYTVEVPVQPLFTSTAAPSSSVFLTIIPSSGYVLGTNTTAEIRVIREATLSVKDFGAAGDGVTDDTAAIQAAITALEASTDHNTLFFPSGTYRLNTPMQVTDSLFYPPQTFNQFLLLGHNDLAGRDLFFVGDTNSVLYSTVSWERVRILMVHATFRTLTFRGLTFQKEPKALPPTSGENNADAVYLKNQDLRRIESVDFKQCTFNNCHSSVSTYGDGYDIRGRFAHFRMAYCNVLNPYGFNTTNGAASYGGGTQVLMNSWVGEALYHDNLFDGGSDSADPVYDPDGVRKDGSHFGSPLNLVFTNNVVLYMWVESVFQTDDPSMGTTTSAFAVPAVGAATNVTLRPYPTTFIPGQVLNFRTYTNSSDAVNILLTASGWDPSTSTLTVTNPGLTASYTGLFVPADVPVYLQDYNPTVALISGNIVSDPTQIGNEGIVFIAKGTVTHNFVHGYRGGIYIYPSEHNPYAPPTPGSLIASNIVDTSITPNWKIGVISYGPGVTILQNLVIKESTNSFLGVSVRCTNSWIRGNVVLSRGVFHESYDSGYRSVGISFWSTSMTTSMENHTYGMDVGIGPEIPFDVEPHRVISHFSTQDALSIDPLGVY